MMGLFKPILKECPFCGSTNLRLTGPESVNEHREYEVSISCEECDCMLPLRVGYRAFHRNRYEKDMITPLFRKWNERSGFKITMDVEL